MSTTDTKLTVAEFLEKAGVERQIQALRDALLMRAEQQGRPPGYMPVFSDMITVENGQEYQWVDYVQEGGGVLGVALVGYTYVLERLGIRFIKVAGTSAGAINTLMLAAVDPTHYKTDLKGNPVAYTTQSEAILHEMLSYDLWNLVDSEGSWWKKMINRFISRKDYTSRLKRMATRLLVTVVGLSLLALTLSLFNLGPRWLQTTAWIISLGGLLAWVLTLWLGMTLRSKAGAFVKAGFGINKGDAFHEWMTGILHRNGIRTTNDLNTKLNERIANVRLRPERFDMHGMGYDSKVGGTHMKIIACDVTNENKVEFPDFARFYYEDPGSVNPADYVRASMSIPIFYQPFTLKIPNPETRFAEALNAPVPNPHQLREYDKFKAVLRNVHADAQEVRFVDGGILSNFPINVFHNPRIAVARMPTLGALLEDEEHEKPGEQEKKKLTLGSYLGSIFSTIRFYYDRDFLKKNSVYQLGLAHIDVAGVNWLNFSISTEEQIDLFRRGVSAATTFFLGGTFYQDGKPFPWKGYDWQEYKRARRQRLIS